MLVWCLHLQRELSLSWAFTSVSIHCRRARAKLANLVLRVSLSVPSFEAHEDGIPVDVPNLAGPEIRSAMIDKVASSELNLRSHNDHLLQLCAAVYVGLCTAVLGREQCAHH